MPIGQTHLMIGIVAIILSIMMLFFIFYSLQKLADDCKNKDPKPEICGELGSFTIPMLIILLFIGGFIILVLSTTYIILSS